MTTAPNLFMSAILTPLLLAGVVIASLNHQRSDPPTVEVDELGMLKEAEAAFSQANAVAWRDEVFSHIEAFAGKPFRESPNVLAVDRKTMLAAWERDIRRSLGAGAHGEIPDDQATTIMLLVLDSLEKAPFMFARYCETERVVHVPAGNAKPLVTFMGLEREPLADIMKLVIAHELAHALHAQHVEPGAANRVRTEDERKALDATFEGFAMLVQTGVAQRLNLSDLNGKLIKASQLDDAQFQSASALGRRYREIYVTGLRFFEHHHASAGMDGVWKILADPPRTYAHVTQPARYGERLETEVDINRLFAGLDTRIGDGKQGKSMTLAGESAGRLYAALGTEDGKRGAAAIVKAYVWTLSLRPHVRNVTCYELRDPASSADLINVMDAKFTAQTDPMKERARKLGAVVDEQRLELGLDNITGFIRTVSIVNNHNASDKGCTTFAAAARDRYVVQVVVSGTEIVTVSARAVAELLLARITSDEVRVHIPAADTSNELVVALQRIKELLGEGQWTESIHPQPRSAVEKLIGENIKGQLALELGWQGSQAVALEAADDPRSSRRMLMTALMQFSNEESAAAVCQAIGPNLGAMFDQFRQFNADVRAGEIVHSKLASGEPCCTKEAALNYMGDTMHLTAIVTQRGRYLIYALDTNKALGTERINDLVSALLKDLP